jgi:hypothetical protein
MDSDGEADSRPHSSGPLLDSSSADSLQPMGPPTASDLQHIQAMLTSPATNMPQGRTSTLARAHDGTALPARLSAAMLRYCTNSPGLLPSFAIGIHGAGILLDGMDAGPGVTPDSAYSAGVLLNASAVPPHLLTAVDWDTSAALEGVTDGGAVGIKRRGIQVTMAAGTQNQRTVTVHCMVVHAKASLFTALIGTAVTRTLVGMVVNVYNLPIQEEGKPYPARRALRSTTRKETKRICR